MGQTVSIQELETRVMAWAERQPNIRAILVVGSRARRDHPGDRWADLDLMLFATDFAGYLAQTDWLNEVGPVWVAIPHQTGAGDPEWLVLFEGGDKVDFIFYPVAELHRLSQLAHLSGVYRRGYYTMVDKDGLAAQVPPSPFEPPPYEPPSAGQFLLTANTFWYGAVYVAKQIRRRELWVAKFRDGTMKEQLFQMIEWHAQAGHGWNYNTWYGGKFLAKWTDSQTWQALQGAFGRFDAADSWQALLATMALFRRLATETALQLGYDYPARLDEQISRYVNQLYAEDDLSTTI